MLHEPNNSVLGGRTGFIALTDGQHLLGELTTTFAWQLAQVPKGVGWTSVMANKTADTYAREMHRQISHSTKRQQLLHSPDVARVHIKDPQIHF